MAHEKAAHVERTTPRYEVSAFSDGTAKEAERRPQIVSISLASVCIQCDIPEEIGTEVELLIHFPDLNASLSLRGQVMWVNRTAPIDIGIRFLNLDAKKRPTLEQYLQKAHAAAIAAAA